MNRERTLHLNCGISLGCDFADHLMGSKDDLGITLAFQHVLVHLMVARAVTSIAACSIHNNFTTGISVSPIEEDRTVLQLEAAVYSSMHVVHRDVDLGLRRIQRDLYLLGRPPS